jgi:hypothetical protein
MISNDVFVNVFGLVAEGDIAQYHWVARAICQAEYTLHLVTPELAPVCTLAPAALKKAAKAGGCSEAHPITCPMEAKRVAARLQKAGVMFELAVDLELSDLSVVELPREQVPAFLGSWGRKTGQDESWRCPTVLSDTHDFWFYGRGVGSGLRLVPPSRGLVVSQVEKLPVWMTQEWVGSAIVGA